MLLAIVLFPEPVEPIIPSESPAFNLKETSLMPSIPVSWYLKQTFLNSTEPLISIFLFAKDIMLVFSSRNSLILLWEADALCIILVIHPRAVTGQVNK